VPALPRRLSSRLLRALELSEDIIYVLVAFLLTSLAVVLMVDVVSGVVGSIRASSSALSIALTVLDKSLVLFIVAELLHTVRITVQDRSLDAEPFLVVGLIAAIRRVLILTAQGENSFRWNPQGIELTILIALILVIAVAILVWRRSGRGTTSVPL
jgi:uncharacterized membrane protein (DUF373 family)